jgi:hypothetical protein
MVHDGRRNQELEDTVKQKDTDYRAKLNMMQEIIEKKSKALSFKVEDNERLCEINNRLDTEISTLTKTKIYKLFQKLRHHCKSLHFIGVIRGQSPSPLTGMFFFGLYHQVRLGVRGGNYVRGQ